MIAFDPFSPMYIWFKVWRKHIEDAYRFPEQKEGYCRAAAIAQMMCVCYTAIELAKDKQNG